MKPTKTTVLNGNQAVSQMAYKVNDSCIVYPITPASEMSELAEQWSSEEKQNIFGNVPTVVEMQSEAGVAGTMHGSLQAGTTTTTFTASQGLLLMMPNMYRIAGELTPNVIHVATRSIATHALSVFGDHSDIMAVRNTGYALLGAASVQEAADFALIAQAASLKSSIPFVHFFDGFRTSHEFSTIQPPSNEIIRAMMDENSILRFKDNRLTPDNPVIRGTAQGPDVFFQGREAVNSHYDQCAQIVSETMNLFGRLTGRFYKPFEYIGDPNADRVVVVMGSACDTLEQTVNYLNSNGEKTALVKVRLFRPFNNTQLASVLPKSCRKIAVLDRTKEPGSSAEPLCLDVQRAVATSDQGAGHKPQIIGGRYGLGSKEFTPGMAIAVFDELKKDTPEIEFTVGIEDDITHLSLSPIKEEPKLDNGLEIILSAENSKEETDSFNRFLKCYSPHDSIYLQAFKECDYKKSKTDRITHIRVDSKPVRAPYAILNADLLICYGIDNLVTLNLLRKIRKGGTVLVISNDSVSEVKAQIKDNQTELLIKKNIRLAVVNMKSSDDALLPHHQILSELRYDLPADDLLKQLDHLVQYVDLDIQEQVYSLATKTDDDDFIGKLVAGSGNSLPVSSFPADGTYQSNTAKRKKNKEATFIPDWDMEACTQCGACSLACPLAAIRAKAFNQELLAEAPLNFKYAKSTLGADLGPDMLFAIEVNPDQCDSCSQCLEACEEDALQMKQRSEIGKQAKEQWEFFENIPYIDPAVLEPGRIDHLALRQPLFEYPEGDQGCGQAPYLKLMTQLFGDRLMVANATGSSSIFGGALPTTPWATNSQGRGPSWSNSLFEDNAEFGLGFRLSLDQQQREASELLRSIREVPKNLTMSILNADQNTDSEIKEQRKRIENLKKWLKQSNHPMASQLYQSVDCLVEKSVWIVGGDGWAYDIGFGGIDHVVATGRNVNILILDNEVYDNTGGQMSKSTPRGARAKFAHHGKKGKKKDLGQMLMSYEDVYVASVSLGADPAHTLKTFIEAEKYNGPSVIIAYCHSKAHGIDMTKPVAAHKAVVDSGRWLLYRFDPCRIATGLNPMQLDSAPPSIPLETAVKKELRYKSLFDSPGIERNFQLELMQREIDKRYARYAAMASENVAYQLNVV